MRVFCPTCSEPINIADDLAGKTTSCPLCQAAFTAPPLFNSSAVGEPVSAANAASSAAAAVSAAVTRSPSPAPSAPAPSVPLPTSIPAPVPSAPVPSDRPSGYARSFGVSISPEIIQWAAPICLGLCVVLTFFSWNGAFPGGHAVYTQGPWRALVGSISMDNVGEKVLKMNPTTPPEGQMRLKDQVRGNYLLLLYLPLLLLTFGLAVFFTILPTLPVRVPPNLVSLLPWRMLVVAGLGIVITVLLAIQSARGFGLENALEAKAKSDVRLTVPDNPSDEDIIKKEIEEGMLMGGLNVRHTTALQLVFVLQIIAILAAAATYVMTRRNDVPTPRIEVLW